MVNVIANRLIAVLETIILIPAGFAILINEGLGRVKSFYLRNCGWD